MRAGEGAYREPEEDATEELEEDKLVIVELWLAAPEADEAV